MNSDLNLNFYIFTTDEMYTKPVLNYIRAEYPNCSVYSTFVSDVKPSLVPYYNPQAYYLSYGNCANMVSMLGDAYLYAPERIVRLDAGREGEPLSFPVWEYYQRAIDSNASLLFCHSEDQKNSLLNSTTASVTRIFQCGNPILDWVNQYFSDVQDGSVVFIDHLIQDLDALEKKYNTKIVPSSASFGEICTKIANSTAVCTTNYKYAEIATFLGKPVVSSHIDHYYDTDALPSIVEGSPLKLVEKLDKILSSPELFPVERNYFGDGQGSCKKIIDSIIYYEESMM